MKHLQIDYHFVRERVVKGDLLVQHVSSADQFANILTKGLSTPLFRRHCSNLMLGSFTLVIEGDVKISKALLLPPVKRIENTMVRKFVNIVRQLTKSVTVD